ncbi:DUF4382 domain-containing protein [Hymenobacter sp. ASUV-10]|uniref:DUF4382 domain-containing protein n=1 Tax=Hymenobacter aranciens TaxID=3063996 RepID=A0ABT9BC04_9BACT|nr:DUF4382 domain-containing protein [Hymenobacter sp. ASUV-10]MDO7875168.1 DUF4382 domain-containing protein [Hymenobacter sp. ASUV-10]
MKSNFVMKINQLFPAFALALLGLASCSKDSSDDTSGAGMSKFEVRLTDAPGDYAAVNIDVQQVQVHVTDGDDEAGWQTLPLIRPGVYNIMDYTNGNSVGLVSADFPAGKISQIRLILGPNNTLVLRDGTVKALTTPSAQQSGLKLKIDATLVRDVTYQLLLDFDVAKSIVKRGNSGQYNLKPVIRTITTAVAGGIRGVATPASTRPLVLAIRTSTVPNDTLSTTADAAGGFLLRGVPTGNYRVELHSGLLYPVVTRNISVSNDQITDLGTVAVR